jgi:hypothetical protein
MNFLKLGDGKLTHTIQDGFTIEGFHNGSPFRICKKPLQSNSLHIEYDYCYIKPFDCVEISTENDSFTCYPKKQNVVTKMAFATEAIYQKQMREKRTATREK